MDGLLLLCGLYLGGLAILGALSLAVEWVRLRGKGCDYEPRQNHGEGRLP